MISIHRRDTSFHRSYNSTQIKANQSKSTQFARLSINANRNLLPMFEDIIGILILHHPYINRISTVYHPYIIRISTVYQPYINCISSVYQLYIIGILWKPVALSVGHNWDPDLSQLESEDNYWRQFVIKINNDKFDTAHVTMMT